MNQSLISDYALERIRTSRERQQIPPKTRSWLLIPQPSNFSQHNPSELPETGGIWERSGARNQQILHRTKENLQLSGWLTHAGAGINCSAAAATWRGGTWRTAMCGITAQSLFQSFSSSNADEGQIALPAEQRLTPGAETLKAAMGLMENHQE